MPVWPGSRSASARKSSRKRSSGRARVVVSVTGACLQRGRRRRAGTSDQPYDAEQIDDADQRAAPVRVLRVAASTRPVVDGVVDQRVTVAPEQRGQEAVHALKAGQQ